MLIMLSGIPFTASAAVTITDVSFEPVEVIENYHGYFTEDYDEETDWFTSEYFYYDIYSELQFTVKFSDGEEFTDSGWGFWYGDEYYEFEVETDQSYNNQWTVGNTYNADVSVSDITMQVPVTVVKSPVSKIEVEPFSIVEGTEGYLTSDYDWETDEETEEYFYYEFDHILPCTVTWTDGTTSVKDGYDVVYGDDWYTFGIDTNQSYDNQWKAGNTYTVSVSLMGVTAEADVTIEEAPVRSISVKPVALIENMGGYLENDYDPDRSYYHYRPESAMEYTIIWKDGTVTDSKGTLVEYKGNTYEIQTYDGQSEETPWVIGNTYSMDVYFMGKRLEVPVTIEETPVQSIEVIKEPQQTEYNVGEAFTPEGAVLRLNYKDGTYEDIVMDYSADLASLGGYECYVKRFDDYFRMEMNGVPEAVYGMKSYTMTLLGYVIEMDIVVNNRKVQSLSIANNGFDLEITATYSDGYQKKMKALGMYVGYGNETSEDIQSGGMLVTDEAVFSGEFWELKETGEVYIRLGNKDADRITSNRLDECLWWKAQEKINRLAYSVAYGREDQDAFAGEVTAENIDELVKIMCHYTSLHISEGTPAGNARDYYTIPADKIEEGFVDMYGATPDLTLSENYDAESDTYKVFMPGSGGLGFKFPVILEYSDGRITAEIEWKRSYIRQEIVLDKDLHMVGYNCTYETTIEQGDVNKDGTLNVRDATAIQKHLASIVTLDDKALSVADFDGDMRISVRDATAIQKKLAGII